MIDAPPFNGWLFVTYATLHTNFRHAWVVMVNRMPVSALPVAALALAAFWLWSMMRCIPALPLVMALWH